MGSNESYEIAPETIDGIGFVDHWMKTSPRFLELLQWTSTPEIKFNIDLLDKIIRDSAFWVEKRDRIILHIISRRHVEKSWFFVTFK